uniref:RHS repeat domain-containing protein n=1 Tax=Flavobacterium adhaerens TaxID=3149043 RepID=UPI0032B4C9CF
VGNTTAAPTQIVDYTYNIRGWLKGINDVAALSKSGDPKDLFAFKINYNTPSSGISGVNALYNGNISETQWKTNFDEGNLRTYGYKYDNINRLREAIYKKVDNTNTIFLNLYNEKMDYDKNGNIMHLTRYGSLNDSAQTLIDNLTYNYLNTNQSNQLSSVDDTQANNSNFLYEFKNVSGTDYSYDANGNMKKDLNKGIGTATTDGITYNHLDLPTKITFGTAGNIVYIYNAAGQKVQKVVTQGSDITTTDYLGGYQYVKAGSNQVGLKFFPTAEGYVEAVTASSFKYIYQYKDHLGNIRVSYDKALVIQEENNYYPFGLKQEGYNTAKNSTNDGLKYKYNGKELQDELGLNVTAMDFRQYDNALGRFNSIDALSEMSFSTSPFAFARNNPVFWMDPSGLLSQEFINSLWNNSNNSSGKTVWTNTGGSFYSDNIGNGKAGSVDNTTNEFTGHDALSEVTITKNNRGDASYLGQLQAHVYSTGKFYSSWRTRQRINKFSDLGQGLQDIGDGIAIAGYALTATGVLAEVGVPLAGIGNSISLGGSVISTAAASAQVYYGNDVSKNGFKIAKAAGVFAAGEISKKLLNKVPGLEPTLKNVDGEEVMNLGSEILQQNVSLKIMGIDRYIDAKTDKE